MVTVTAKISNYQLLLLLHTSITELSVLRNTWYMPWGSITKSAKCFFVCLLFLFCYFPLFCFHFFVNVKIYVVSVVHNNPQTHTTQRKHHSKRTQHARGQEGQGSPRRRQSQQSSDSSVQRESCASGRGNREHGSCLEPLNL